MKQVLLILIILLVLLAPAMNNTNAVWLARSAQELWDGSYTILVGKIVSVNSHSFEKSTQNIQVKHGQQIPVTENYTLNLDEYSVKVEKYLKNPQVADLLKLQQPTDSLPGRIVPIGSFSVDNRVLFYVYKNNLQDKEYLEYAPESFVLPETCDADKLAKQPRLHGTDLQIRQGDNTNTSEFRVGKEISFKLTVGNDNLAYSQKNQTIKINDEIIKPTIKSEKCVWNSIFEWTYTPIKNGKYKLEISSTDGESLLNPFTVKETNSILTPLKQHKSGIVAEDVKCKEGMQLVIKAKDGSPACVKESSVTKLVVWGWANH